MKTEILVIGAGPAGSVASAMLVRAGRRVTCLEGGEFPRFQIGESLLPRCNDILDEAGLLEAVRARNYMPKPAALFLDGDRHERFSFAEMFPGQRPAAMQVPRADFDQTLATEARRLGVDLRFQQRVDAVDFGETGAVAHVCDSETGRAWDVEADFVLDCSGYGRVLPKLLKLEKPALLGPRCALFAHFEGDRRPAGAREGDIWIVIHPLGLWCWIIPFSNGRTSVGIVGDRQVIEAAGENDRDRLVALLQVDSNTSERLGRAQPVTRVGRLEGWSAAVTAFHGPRWAVTGNASEFLDPIFSSGVTLALESSHRAAKLVHRQLSGKDVDWDAEYSHVLERAVGVFRVFVRTWYSGELKRVLLHASKDDKVKRAITAVLGGYVLDDRNPFVRNPEGMLGATLRFASAG